MPSADIDSRDLLRGQLGCGRRGGAKRTARFETDAAGPTCDAGRAESLQLLDQVARFMHYVFCHCGLDFVRTEGEVGVEVAMWRM
jgi:hypothetical protein